MIRQAPRNQCYFIDRLYFSSGQGRYLWGGGEGGVARKYIKICKVWKENISCY